MEQRWHRIVSMKTIKTETKRKIVSQIVQTIDKDGRDVLGFTVFDSDQCFYNVMRCFSAEDYDQVLEGLREERRQLQENEIKKEKT